MSSWACPAPFPTLPMKSELRRFLRGFHYAASGIWAALRAERNLRFHLCAAVYVLLFSRFYSFGRLEYALLFLCIGGVMSLELANSAVERAVDRPDAEHWAAAGLAKDMAAGAPSTGAGAAGGIAALRCVLCAATKKERVTKPCKLLLYSWPWWAAPTWANPA